ncbi:hypothetical protein M0802_009809 [Mischocyttarus mexicanus]|nr:hypothetical protein M0802_009809 [Mischocyttarus mexicanus]
MSRVGDDRRSRSRSRSRQSGIDRKWYQQVSDLVVASQLARQGKARQSKAKQSKARQGKARCFTVAQVSLESSRFEDAAGGGEEKFLREPRTSSRKCCGVPPVRSSEYSSPSNELLLASCGGQFRGSCGSIANETLLKQFYIAYDFSLFSNSLRALNLFEFEIFLI